MIQKIVGLALDVAVSIGYAASYGYESTVKSLSHLYRLATVNYALVILQDN